ncbi:hypothetical protein [Liquorilactobacillus mali]|uniref:hypothetical protein n=1 Tax=Liquorilactobacillus mali TaxID=1618 RepID=UPI0023508C30|nr:hypothetical protein [Liquorilactobacillus mali]MDC7952546.1 hypothetical protein [Liquorilactobacillus mali]
MGLYILMFATVLGVILLGFGISKIKQRQTVIGYILSIIGIAFLIFAGYDIIIILHALFA